MTGVKSTVVFIHGLGRTHRCFRALRRRVEAAGYPTWAKTWPGRASTADAATWLLQRIHGDVGPGPLIGVTHSLGGIIARRLADALPWEALVMMAPPNRGSRLARVVQRHHLGGLFVGPAAAELARPDGWPDPPAPFAVIAGTRPGRAEAAHLWLGRRLGAFGRDQAHDGVIAVDETHHPGAAAFATVHSGHNFLMDDPAVHALVLRFLKDRRF